MEHLDDRRIIDIATRDYEPTEEERTHLKECQRCRHLIVTLVLKIQSPDGIVAAEGFA